MKKLAPSSATLLSLAVIFFAQFFLQPAHAGSSSSLPSFGICVRITNIDNPGDRFARIQWDYGYNQGELVAEAKRRGLSCKVGEFAYQGVGGQPLSDNALCWRANWLQNSSLTWWPEGRSRTRPNVLEAKRRGLRCQLVNGVPVSISSTASSKPRNQPNLASRTDSSICTLATYHGGSRNKIWDTSARWAEFVAEAKRRGLDCDVGETHPRSRPPQVSKKQPDPAPAPKSDPEKLYQASSGSGFAVSKDGHLVTNHHVIDGCQAVGISHEGEMVSTRVLARDPVNDLAVLKGDFKPKKVFAFSKKNPELMQDVFVAGFPFGKKVSSSVKVTKGIVSSMTGIQNNYANMQIDAALQPGNSGGPILDEAGNVIGIAVAKLDTKVALEKFNAIPENTNFGVKASVAKAMLSTFEIDLESPSDKEMPRSEMGRLITDGTFYISCGMTMAQIQKMKSRKVMFEELE